MGTWRDFSRVTSPVRGEAGLCSEALCKFPAGPSPIRIFCDFDIHHRSPGTHMDFVINWWNVVPSLLSFFSKEDYLCLLHALLLVQRSKTQYAFKGTRLSGEELVGGRRGALPPVLGTLSTPPLLHPTAHASGPEDKSHSWPATGMSVEEQEKGSPALPAAWWES